MTAKSDVGALEASGLISLAAMQPELEYLFRHVLVQDAAYASLLKQERRELHRRVADTLEQIYPERRGELAGVIGMHLEEAGEPARAAPFLIEAGDHALARFANREARAFFDRAYAGLPADAADSGVALLRVRAGISAVKAGWGSSIPSADLGLIAEIIPIVDRLDDPRLATEVHFWNILLRRSAGGAMAEEATRQSVERLERLGAEHGDPVAQAMPQALMGAGLVFGGQLRAGVSLLEKAVPVIESGGDARGLAILHDILTIAYARLGDFAAAERNAERADRAAERGDPIARLDAMIARAIIASERGDLEDAVRLAGDCVETAESLGATGCAIPANYFLGDGRLRLGEAASARVRFERALQLSATELGSTHLSTLSQAGLASAIARLGDPAGGAAGWEASLAVARKVGDRFGEATILASRASTLARDRPAEWSGILADLEAAIGAFEDMETRPELARALRTYAKALTRAGREEDGHAALARSRAIADELGLRDRDIME